MGDESCDDNLADATGGAHHNVGLQSIPGPVQEHRGAGTRWVTTPSPSSN